jgi:hypothetical protein
MIESVQIVSVPVNDQEKAGDFYVETSGFELLADEGWGSTRWGSRWTPRTAGSKADDPAVRGVERV